MAPSNENFRHAQQFLEQVLLFPDPMMMMMAEEFEESSYYYQEQQYHELYLQRQGMEFEMPVLFEDGMDYVECELYYYATQQQSPKPSALVALLAPVTPRTTTLPLRPLDNCCSSPEQQPSSTNKQDSTITSSSLVSCMRRPRRRASMVDTTPPLRGHRSDQMVRRCSFSCMPPLLLREESRRNCLVRSHSMEDLSSFQKVGFEEYVQVVTIHSAADYPDDVRSSMWMSRQEMNRSMRRGTTDVRQKEPRPSRPQQLE
jgi:hypothetical protein